MIKVKLYKLLGVPHSPIIRIKMKYLKRIWFSVTILPFAVFLLMIEIWCGDMDKDNWWFWR